MKAIRFLSLGATFIAMGAVGCAEPPPPPLQTNLPSNALNGRWTTPRPAHAQPSLAATAEVVAHPFADVVVASPVEGRLVDLRRAPGDHVDTGDVVAVVQSPLLAAAAVRVVGLEREIKLLEGRLTQLAALQQTGLARRETLFQLELRRAEATSARDEAAATLRAAGAQMNHASRLAVRGGRLVVVAGAPGVVTALHHALGEGVAAGDPIATVASMATPRVRAQLPVGLLTQERLSFTSSTGTWSARRLAVAPAVRPSDQTSVAWFEVVHDDNASTEGPAIGERGVLSLPAAEATRSSAEASSSTLWSVPAGAVHVDNAGATVTVRRAGTHRTEGVDVVHRDKHHSVVRGALSATDEVLVVDSKEMTP